MYSAGLSLPSRALVCFAIVLTVLTISASQFCYRDPTSWFFRPKIAARHGYSAVRQVEAAEYIESARGRPQIKASKADPELCLVIGSVAREGARYFKDTVGSVLAGLDPQERQRLHLILFLAHTNQSVHPAYSEGWIENVADTVLSYENLSPSTLERVKEMEAAKGDYREKGIFDYVHMLRACHATGASHMAVFEDDLLVMDDWMGRTFHGLQQASIKTERAGLDQYLYLRLFYTETYFGWNSEEWPIYLIRSAEVFALVVVLVFGMKYIFRFDPDIGEAFSTPMILLYLFVFTPACILLVFACGRVTMFPIPDGVNEMAQFGCCSQALMFSRERAVDIANFLEDKRIGFVDESIEEFANNNHEMRWALTPSIAQHIGSKTSKTGDADVTTWIWNYRFETFDPIVLRRAHQLSLRYGHGLET